MKKRVFAFLAALLILAAFALPVFAEGEEDYYSEYDVFDPENYETATYTAPNGYSYDYFVPYYDSMMEEAHRYENVWDFADLLDESEEAALQTRANERKNAGFNVYFLTYDNACGKGTMTFTDDFYDYYITKLDFSNQVTGVLYAVDMDNREVFINTGGKLSDAISYDKAYDLLDKTYTYASNGAYTTCLLETDKVTMKYLDPSLLDKLMPTVPSLIFSVVVTVIVVIILFMRHNKENRAPAAETYSGQFRVIERNAVFAGHRQEVLHGYYSSSSSGGGGSHSSGGGGSHGGGGHGF